MWSLRSSLLFSRTSRTLLGASNYPSLFTTTASNSTSTPKPSKSSFCASLEVFPNRLKSTKATSEPPLQSDRLLTIPNALCLGRICASPLLASWVLDHHYCYALAGFVVAGATDLIDGQIARHVPNQSSRLGSFLDPLADKVLCTALYLSLASVQLLPASLAFLVISRDVLLIVAGLYVRYLAVSRPFTWKRYFDMTTHGAQIQPPFISKANTMIQLAMVFYALSLPVLHLRQDSPFFLGFCALTGTTTFVSGLAYVFQPNTYRFASRSYEHEQMKKVSALALFMVANAIFMAYYIKHDLHNLSSSDASSPSKSS